MKHSCQPNAVFRVFEGARAVILFADRPIRAGEKITMAYETFADLKNPPEPDAYREKLKKRSIECPPGIATF